MVVVEQDSQKLLVGDTGSQEDGLEEQGADLDAFAGIEKH